MEGDFGDNSLSNSTKLILITAIAESMNLSISNVYITQMSLHNSSLSVRCQITILNPATDYESTLWDATSSGALTTTIQKVASSYNNTALMTATCSSITLGIFIKTFSNYLYMITTS